MGLCCDPKRGAGKVLVVVFAVLFGCGVVASTCSPNWIAFGVAAPDAGAASSGEATTAFAELGPFYGRYRTCMTSDKGKDYCSDWETRAVGLSDCEVLSNADDEPDELKALCRHLAAWRSLGILCLVLVLIGGGLVLAASCCQAVTCGCCGNSLTCISNVLFGAEVLLSIAAWSLAVSALKRIEGRPAVTASEYQWAFWLFLASGTVVGALATWMADWAAEDSCLRGLWRCVTCRACRGKGEEDDKVEPLIGGV